MLPSPTSDEYRRRHRSRGRGTSSHDAGPFRRRASIGRRRLRSSGATRSGEQQGEQNEGAHATACSRIA
jgi:hypothetical protein